MGREIKFRAFDKDYRKMSDSATIDELLNHSDDWFGFRIHIGGRYVPVDDCEITQFTGIIDKNGKEVYEGDLVKRKRFSTGKHLYTSKVVFMNGCFMLEPSVRHLEDYLYKYNSYDELEVIGNIFEHPELCSK